LCRHSAITLQNQPAASPAKDRYDGTTPCGSPADKSHKNLTMIG